MMSGNLERAAFLLPSEPLRAFGYKAADDLIQEGRADSVVAYSTPPPASGFAG